MRKQVRLITALLCGLGFASTAGADEGMWQPHQLPELRDRLTELGLEIDPSKLSDLLSHPMNAVVSLGGCTASFVSPQGLVITNYHCAFGSIQYNSTEESNLELTGFLAREAADELPAAPGSRVLVTVDVDDVTQEMVGGLTEGLSGRARYQALEDREKSMIAECEKDAGHRCSVRAFHGGLEYYRIKQLEIRDVRLVYAPPGAIGQFGGEIDNWMWPRHTGDFAFLRAYVGPDGKPADPSDENVPYAPTHWLEVSTSGLQPGDFVMVIGYPGRTNRYRTAIEVDNAFTWYYPTRRKLLLESLAVIERETAGRPDAAIAYASRVDGLNNSIKNYQGMIDGFGRSDVLDRKQREEQALRDWVEADPARRERYLVAMERLERLIAEQQSHRERSLYYEYLVRNGALFDTARDLYRLSRERQKPDPQREPGYQERDMRRFRSRLERLDRRFDPEVDRASWREFILEYATTPVDQHVREFDAYFGIRGQEVNESKLNEQLAKMYRKTGLGDGATRLGWMEAPLKKFESSDDPFIRLAAKLYDSDIALEEQEKELDGSLEEARSLYMAALIEYRKSLGQSVYADANGTLRVTYGSVQGYSPRDGVTYTPFTRLEGVVEKETGADPFASPPTLLEAAAANRYGAYRDERLETVPVNFLSNVDTTGGNSGSPTLDSKARLTGLLFDGNFESIIADWDFIPSVTRSIHVDMRYVLWVMTYVDHADRLLREMGVPGPAEARTRTP